jgi:hypothetical protein
MFREEEPGDRDWGMRNQVKLAMQTLHHFYFSGII